MEKQSFSPMRATCGPRRQAAELAGARGAELWDYWRGALAGSPPGGGRGLPYDRAPEPGERQDRHVRSEQDRAEDAHESGPPRARRLEREHEVEADDHERRGGGRPRLEEPQVEDVERDQVGGRHPEPGGDTGGHRKASHLAEGAKSSELSIRNPCS